MASITSHRDLIVWQKSMELCVQIYQLCARFPRDERYRLTDQITRAVVSVPTNIAEGYGRGSSRDYARFLAIARGSLVETETCLMLAVRLGHLQATEATAALGLMGEIGRMLNALRSKILPS